MWIVPILLSSPGLGALGEVGMVAVSGLSGEVVGATPKSDVRSAGSRLAQERRHDVDAAFRRARTT
jgi:hypothetical protein